MLETYGEEIAEAAGDARALIEFGSGSSRKTNLLLDALTRIELYVPIDVSGDFLADAARRLARRREGLAVKPLVADFTKTCTLPGAARGLPKLGFFSGSTIGNLGRAEARSFLQSAAGLLGAGSTFLVGVDLKKDPSILIPAYDDGQGVTAEFNLNLLARINRELDGQIDVTQFAHRAIYNGVLGRMEMYLESLARQTATVLGRKFHFAQGRAHSHREFAQIFGGRVPGARTRLRLGAAAGLDGSRPALQPALVAARLETGEARPEPRHREVDESAHFRQRQPAFRRDDVHRHRRRFVFGEQHDKAAVAHSIGGLIGKKPRHPVTCERRAERRRDGVDGEARDEPHFVLCLAPA